MYEYVNQVSLQMNMCIHIYIYTYVRIICVSRGDVGEPLELLGVCTFQEILSFRAIEAQILHRLRGNIAITRRGARKLQPTQPILAPGAHGQLPPVPRMPGVLCSILQTWHFETLARHTCPRI